MVRSGPMGLRAGQLDGYVQRTCKLAVRYRASEARTSMVPATCSAFVVSSAARTASTNGGWILKYSGATSWPELSARFGRTGRRPPRHGPCTPDSDRRSSRCRVSRGKRGRNCAAPRSTCIEQSAYGPFRAHDFGGRALQAELEDLHQVGVAAQERHGGILWRGGAGSSPAQPCAHRSQVPIERGHQCASLASEAGGSAPEWDGHAVLAEHKFHSASNAAIGSEMSSAGTTGSFCDAHCNSVASSWSTTALGGVVSRAMRLAIGSGLSSDASARRRPERRRHHRRQRVGFNDVQHSRRGYPVRPPGAGNSLPGWACRSRSWSPK